MVPAVIVLTISLFTRPFASLGFSNCSHIATFIFSFKSFGIYIFKDFTGIPAIGTFPMAPPSL